MDRKDADVLIAAEEVILDPLTTEKQIEKVIEIVDKMGNAEASIAIRRTLSHEKRHRAQEEEAHT